jgi:hypothetical protein
MSITASSLRHCEKQNDEAIHFSACGTMDCFASLAMTEPCVERRYALSISAKNSRAILKLSTAAGMPA